MTKATPRIPFGRRPTASLAHQLGAPHGYRPGLMAERAMYARIDRAMQRIGPANWIKHYPDGFHG